MSTRTLVAACVATVCVATASLTMSAAPEGAVTSVAAAAERQDVKALKALLAGGGDVNASQGDGMTALHWAAINGNTEIAAMLLYAGADAQATTRLGGYTPLHLASKAGKAEVIASLVEHGARVNATTSTGATALMLAAGAGSADAVRMLIEHKADLNAADSANGETALMFAAAQDRVDAVRELLTHHADAARVSKVTDLSGVVAPEEFLQNSIRDAQNAKSAAVNGTKPPAVVPAGADKGVAGVTRAYSFNELLGKQGGMSALHFASRQGSMRSVQALVEGGAPIDAVSADGVSPLLIASINGQFDIAKYLVEHGADPTIANAGGVTPLYAVLNIEWAPRMFYPQPRAQLQQKTAYLEMMTLLLDKGADPNARLNRKTWFTQYNFDLLRIDDGGATPFWRAAYSSDIDAMKLLLTYGADPDVPTMKPAGRNRGTEVDREAAVVDVSKKLAVPDWRSWRATAGRGRGRRIR